MIRSFHALVVGVHDGDTVRLDVLLDPHISRVTMADLGFAVEARPDGLWLARQAVRLWGCNAPELATPAGQAALAYLQTLLRVGDKAMLTSHGYDKYGGRIDGELVIPRTPPLDIATAMIRSGHAAKWDGKGPKPVPTAEQPLS